MTTTLEQLKKDISAAQARKARAEVLLAQAESDLAATRARLKDEYGVSTPDEARAMLADLKSERDDAIAQASAALEASRA